MPRRYVRDRFDVTGKTDIPLHTFPRGTGPPLFLTSFRREWTRLSRGQGAYLELDRGATGLMAFGLSQSTAVVWVHFPADDGAAAYCYHAPGRVFSQRHHQTALDAFGCRHGAEPGLYVVIASTGHVTESDERYFLARGIAPDRLFTYSHAFLPRFGVNAAGCVGEVSL